MAKKKPEPPSRPPILSSVDDHTAQAELNSEMFSHYVLGRCLAIEEALKEVVAAMPAGKRAEITARIIGSSDDAMRELNDESTDPDTDPKRHVTKCGFVHTLLTLGF
jgi:hypothetical protein